LGRLDHHILLLICVSYHSDLQVHQHSSKREKLTSFSHIGRMSIHGLKAKIGAKLFNVIVFIVLFPSISFGGTSVFQEQFEDVD
jgi:hypothetical protein